MIADWVDRTLEATIAGSFTRLGYWARQKLDHWEPDADANGRVIVITGATSGLGLAAARRWRAAGATVEIIARNPEKAQAVAEALGVGFTVADLGDLDDVERAAAEIQGKYNQIHALVHNAGALDAVRSVTRQGIEQTVATHVLGPMRLTAAMLPVLAPGARVIWVSSGGMYSEPLAVDGLEMPEDAYDGVVAYARAKRAQVTLSEMLAERLADRAIAVHAMHPGWADTPGVERSLPTFRKIVGKALRTPDEGADTVVWLATAPAVTPHTGRFWLDRRPKPTHLRGLTRRSDTEEERDKLWRWVAERAAIPASRWTRSHTSPPR